MNSQAIGNEVGVSRQYVRKVLKAEGYHTSVPRGRKLPRQCVMCGVAIPKRQRFCSPECRKATYLEVTCSFCHVSFKRKRSSLLQSYNLGYNNIYCSQICYSKGQKDI